MERILGHVVGTKVERVYDRALWMAQQRAVLDVGAEATTIARGGAQIVPKSKVAEHA